MCFPGIKFTIDSSDDGAGDPRAGPVGASVPRSLNVESTGLLSSGRACEPLRSQDARGGAGCRLRLVEAPGDQRSCVGRAGGSGCSEAVGER